MLMNDAIYGKIRDEDLPVLKSVIEIFKKQGFQTGLHGTSLWNKSYKDVDLLVVSSKKDADDFLELLNVLKKQCDAVLMEGRGNKTVGLDYDIKIGKLILH